MAILFLVVAYGGPVFAQFSSGIDGTVIDGSGAIVPKAHITITNSQLGVSNTTTSSNSGYFRIDKLPASTYRVEITKESFQSWVEQDLVIEAGQVRTIAPVLLPGRVSSTVTVTAGVSNLDLTSPTTGTVIAPITISQSPLVGQNVYGLASISPGITGTAVASGDNYSNQYDVNTNAVGQRAEANSYSIDGAFVMTAARGGSPIMSPNPEIVQSVSIDANDFDASKGVFSGASTEVYTNSGTNQLHGTGDYYFQNSALIARTEFQTVVPSFSLNEGGVTIGGPFIKSRLFGYGAIDVLRSSDTTSSRATVETEAFSNYVQQNFPNSIAAKVLKLVPPGSYPTSHILTVSQVEASTPGYYPPPNIPGALPAIGSANINYTTPRNGYQWFGRVDDYIKQNDRVFASAMYTTLTSFTGNVRPAFTPRSANNTTLLNTGWTHTFSAHLINEAGVDYLRPYGDAEALPAMAIPNLTILGMNGVSGAGPYNYMQDNLQFRNTTTWVYASHDLQFGVVGTDMRENDQQSGIVDRPSYTFNNMLDFVQDSSVTESATPINLTTLASAGAFKHYRNSYIGLSAQDNWSATRTLTVNLGLRFDDYGHFLRVISPPLSLFTLGPGTSRSEQIASGSVGPPPNKTQNLASNLLWAFNPRIGFSWNAFNRGTTAVRGGVGTFSNRINYVQLEGPLIGNLPFTYAPFISVYQGQATPAFRLCDAPSGFNESCPLVVPTNISFNSQGGLAGLRSSVGGVAPNIRQAEVVNWTFSIQQKLPASLVVEANYSGTAARHLAIVTDVNRYNGDLIANHGVLHRLNASFGPATFETTDGTSIGHFGSLIVTRAPAKGFTVRGIYMLGKSLDVYSTDGGLFANPAIATTNIIQAGDIRAQRGRSDFDIHQQLSLDGVWTLPRIFSGAWKENVFGGWRMSGIAQFETGTPFTVYTSAPYPKGDYNADGYNYDVPNRPSFGNHLPGQSRRAFLNGLFPASAFPSPPLGSEGDIGRNTYDHPGYNDVNFNLEKLVRTPWFHGEKADLELRGEVFNLLNRPNLTGFDSNMADALFGRATSQQPARRIKLHMRLQF